MQAECADHQGLKALVALTDLMRDVVHHVDFYLVNWVPTIGLHGIQNDSE